ncbi:FAD-binding protein [Nocardioides sp. dk4132]|uniref:FAD-binding oxidoreductase n=1 Tax=Nocardioides sp. dk4132 TaxID=2662433 RepID=UPI001295E019|nr:FAD-binding protein [Nocardioides sp. dk4132]MQW74745.1 FAD-binding protein [Nocardioides sp. dk4132]
MTTSNTAAALRGLCEIHLPDDPGYDDARRPWNLSVDQRPAAVAVPSTTREVQALVAAATAAGLRIAPQNAGHGAAALAADGLDDVVVLRLSGLSDVSVDPDACTARIAGATTWGQVVAASSPHGLTALHGSAPSVAAIGYLLGGGISCYGRAHGLATNSVRGLDVVTADGALLHADATEHADLFWALRGAGANLGVVVAVEIDLIAQPDAHAGMMLWDREHAPAVVAAWASWTRDLPESVTSALRIMSFPPLPELPPFLRGRDLVVVDGVALEDDDRAAGLLAPLRALGPELDTFARIPALGVLDVHMDPPEPTPGVGDHAVLGPLEDDAVAAFLGVLGPGTSSGVTIAELRHLGGALARPDAAGGALSAVPGDYALICIAMAPDAGAAAAGRAAAADVVRAMAPWTLPTRIPTFTEARTDPTTMYDAAARERLTGLRDRFDPQRRLLANHPVAAGERL